MIELLTVITPMVLSLFTLIGIIITRNQSKKNQTKIDDLHKEYNSNREADLQNSKDLGDAQGQLKQIDKNKI